MGTSRLDWQLLYDLIQYAFTSKFLYNSVSIEIRMFRVLRDGLLQSIEEFM